MTNRHKRVSGGNYWVLGPRRRAFVHVIFPAEDAWPILSESLLIECSHLIPSLGHSVSLVPFLLILPRAISSQPPKGLTPRANYQSRHIHTLRLHFSQYL